MYEPAVTNDPEDVARMASVTKQLHRLIGASPTLGSIDGNAAHAPPL